MVLIKEKVKPGNLCEFSDTSISCTEHSSKRVIMAPKIKLCNKPAIGIWQDDKYSFVKAYICQDCLDRIPK